VNINASKALHAWMFAQMGQGKGMHSVEHNVSSERFAALGQANCSQTIHLCHRRDFSQRKIPNFPDLLCSIHRSSV